MPPAIPGLRYVPDYLDADDHDRLLFTVNACGWQQAGGRGVQIYGYSYHHAKGGIYRVGDLPAWVSDVAGRLWRDGLMPYAADQMIADQYQGGVGIFSHVDAPAFDDSIVSLSLGSSWVMQFTECDSARVEEMLVEPRSPRDLRRGAREMEARHTSAFGRRMDESGRAARHTGVADVSEDGDHVRNGVKSTR